MSERRKMLFVFPTDWDARQLDSCRTAWEAQFDVAYSEPSDWDCAWDLDILGWIEDAVRHWDGAVAGVTSSSDYPGATVAAALAQKLGLPGPDPAVVLGCSHKYEARRLQRDVVPEATPRFDVLDPDDPDSQPRSAGFPCFVKPVKGAFSVMSGRIDSAAELRAFFSRPSARSFRTEFVHIFNQLVRRYTRFETDGGAFIAEELLDGMQVTVEGYSTDDEVVVLGVTDSELDPRTRSFVRFVHPSALPESVQRRMHDVAIRVVRGAGLWRAFFNIEMLYDAGRDVVRIVEVNPRICGQFGDLYQKVGGRNSYEIALEVASGAVPAPPKPGGGAHAVAASVPLRVFEPVRVARAPDADDVRAAEALYPGTMVWNECKTGQELADFESIEDGHSCRYAVVNVGAPDRDSLVERMQRVRERLGYRFEALEPRGSSGG